MGSKVKELTPEQRRALGAFVKLTRAANSLLGRTQGFARHKLTVSQFGVLEALYNLEPLSQNELASKILKTSGNMTMVLDNLEKRSLIARHRDPEDRRIVRVNLSKSGLSLIETIFPEQVADITAAMARLTAEEQDTLSRICRKLGSAVDT